MTTPEGYLGTDGRITAGPAAELVAAGYALELGDAPLLHDGLHVADLGHVVALLEQRLIPVHVAQALLRELLEIARIGVEDFPYEMALGDAYNSRERELSRRLGDVAGWVHLGRTRREAGRIALRLAVRERLLTLSAGLERLTAALLAQAESTADVVWADTTYLQPAQASTFGHYLASFAEESSRHLSRLRTAYNWADTSPAGSGGVAGTRLGLDRARLAQLLGFTRVGSNTRDDMWNLDGVQEIALVATLSCLTVDRLAEDLQIFTTPGFGTVELHASLCRASVLLPQKRNPYALAVIRSGASSAIGRMTGLLAASRTPSAQTDNWLHAYGEVAGLLDLAIDVVRLAAVVVETLTIDRAAMASAASDPQLAMTDLADEIVLRAGVDYRTAYRIAARLIADAMQDGSAVTAAAFDEAAVAILGRPLSAVIDLTAVLDPVACAQGRLEPGGSSSVAVLTEIASLLDDLARASQWRTDRASSNDAAREALMARVKELASTP